MGVVGWAGIGPRSGVQSLGTGSVIGISRCRLRGCLPLCYWFQWLGTRVRVCGYARTNSNSCWIPIRGERGVQRHCVWVRSPLRVGRFLLFFDQVLNLVRSLVRLVVGLSSALEVLRWPGLGRFPGALLWSLARGLLRLPRRHRLGPCFRTGLVQPLYHEVLTASSRRCLCQRMVLGYWSEQFSTWSLLSVSLSFSSLPKCASQSHRALPNCCRTSWISAGVWKTSKLCLQPYRVHRSFCLFWLCPRNSRACMWASRNCPSSQSTKGVSGFPSSDFFWLKRSMGYWHSWP